MSAKTPAPVSSIQPGITVLSDPIPVSSIRQEITVLPADPPGRPQIGWPVKTYSGCELYHIPADAESELVPASEKEVVPGAKFCTQGLTGIISVTIHEQEDGTMCGMSGPHLMVMLEFDKDDRHCWVASGFINTRGIAKLTLK